MLDIEDFKKKLDKKSRLMGIDPGRKRIGIAICDENKIIATPYTTIIKKKYSDFVIEIKQIVVENQIKGIIIGNPIIFKQIRPGYKGKTFVLYKFRTMKIQSHDERQKLKDENEKGGPLFKMTDDPRFFNGAKLLRKLSLDELPQLINVVKGNMSLVGPRPLFPEDNEFYDHHYLRRLNVLPGITGLLQINERNTSSFETWYKYDIEYIENWSLYLDFKIMLRTPFALFSKKIKGL